MKEITCPKCHNSVSEDTKFCPMCGSALFGMTEEPTASEGKELIECPQCHREVVNEVDECPWCGCKLDKKSISRKEYIQQQQYQNAEQQAEDLTLADNLKVLGSIIITIGTVLSCITCIVGFAAEFYILLLFAFMNELAVITIGYLLKGVGGILRTLITMAKERLQ